MNGRPPTPASVELDAMVAMARRGRASRLAYGAIAGVLGLAVVHPLALLAWYGAVLAWELGLERLCFVAFGLRAPKGPAWRTELRYGVHNGLGGAVWAIFSLLCWQAGPGLGQHMAVVWTCGTALHVFVYLSRKPVLLALNLAPAVAVTLVGPILSLGAGWETAAMIATTLTLFAAASTFAIDRNALLQRVDTETEARAAAEAASAQKSTFLATMSHELRTPLNAVIGYAEILEEDIAAGEARIEDAQRIRGSAQHLLRLINEILDLAKLDADRLTLQPTTTNLGELMGRVADALRPMATAQGNSLQLIVQPGLPDVLIDPLRLTQCLLNLGSNACRFTTHGQVLLTLTAARTEEGHALWFKVADTGRGIAADQIERLFEPFTQADTGLNREHGGAGLGLSITRKLAKLMGGTVEVTSTLGKGSVFTLSLHVSRFADAALAEVDVKAA